MASLWIRSGYDIKVEMSAETYQVGTHFKALIKAMLVAPLKSFERFFRISSSPARLCSALTIDIAQCAAEPTSSAWQMDWTRGKKKVICWTTNGW